MWGEAAFDTKPVAPVQILQDGAKPGVALGCVCERSMRESGVAGAQMPAGGTIDAGGYWESSSEAGDAERRGVNLVGKGAGWVVSGGLHSLGWTQGAGEFRWCLAVLG